MKTPYSLVSKDAVEKDGMTHETFHVMDGEAHLGSVQVVHANGKVRGFKSQGLRSKDMSGVLGALGQRFDKAMPTLAGAIQQMSGAMKPQGGLKTPSPKAASASAAPTAAPDLKPTKSVDPEKRRVSDAMAAQGGTPPKPPKGKTPAAMSAPAPMKKAMSWKPVQGDIDRWKNLQSAVQSASNYMKTADLKHGAVPYMQIALRDADHHLAHARQYMEHEVDKPTAIRAGVGSKEPHLRHMNQLEESLRLWQGHADAHAKDFGATAPALGMPDSPSIAARVGAGFKNAARNTMAAVRPKPSSGTNAVAAPAATASAGSASMMDQVKSRVSAILARGKMPSTVSAPAAAPAAAAPQVAPKAAPKAATGAAGGRASRKPRGQGAP